VLVTALAEAFAQSSALELEALERAAQQSALDEVSRLLHDLKGSAGMAGADEVYALCPRTAAPEELRAVLPTLRAARERDLARLKRASAR
jgi:HPt (histidine-containing phosphotransfer) domain-containing protein